MWRILLLYQQLKSFRKIKPTFLWKRSASHVLCSGSFKQKETDSSKSSIPMQNNQLLLKSKEPSLFMAIEMIEAEKSIRHEEPMPYFLQ
jgi:hypothetical protein